MQKSLKQWALFFKEEKTPRVPRSTERKSIPSASQVWSVLSRQQLHRMETEAVNLPDNRLTFLGASRC
jgi:hypothetical protein